MRMGLDLQRTVGLRPIMYIFAWGGTELFDNPSYLLTAIHTTNECQSINVRLHVNTHIHKQTRAIPPYSVLFMC
jgi:hypothetical protein